MPTGKTIALLIYPTISHVTATLGIARALREKENRIIYPVFEDLQEFIENHDFIFYRLNNYHFARNNEELSLSLGSCPHETIFSTFLCWCCAKEVGSTPTNMMHMNNRL